MRVMLLGLALAAALVGQASAEDRAFTPAEVATIKASSAKARGEFDKTLFDYPSARFRDVTVTLAPKGGNPYVCGLVNAKNRMGAYIGWKRFLWTGESLYVASDGDMGAPIMIEAICDGGAGAKDGKDYSADLTFKP
jgi:hypothetical protein